MSFSSFRARWLPFLFLILASVSVVPAQGEEGDKRADAIIDRAVEALGGERYLNVRTQTSRGKFSLIRDGAIISFQTFHDVIVFPNKERTEFKGGRARTVQTNVGVTGWIYDGDMEVVKDQTEKQIAAFDRGVRVSLDNLLRRQWAGDAKLEYIGRRPSSLGKRNDVLRLTYSDGLEVEFEFSDEGIPQKAIYKRSNADGEEVTEEDRYAQFVETGGIKAPFIIDRFTKGVHVSRINLESVTYNSAVNDSFFAKPGSAKEMKKDLRL